MSVAACIGVAILRPWSRHLVYLLTAGFLLKLSLSVHSSIKVGYFELRFDSTAESFRSLAPTFFMAVLACTCCRLVFKYFHSAERLSGDTDSSRPAVQIDNR